MKRTSLRILIGILLTNLVIGWIITPDFGRSPDENLEALRAEAALKAYLPDSFGKYSDNEIPKAVRFYGTSLTMISHGVEQFLREPLGTNPGDLIHFTYYVYFQLAVATLYFFLLKFIKDWPALVSTILFAYQPFLFGHSFINPKDIPLLFIFLLTVTVGIYMVDSIFVNSEASKEDTDRRKYDFKEAWSNIPGRRQQALYVLLAIWPALLGLKQIVLFFVPRIVALFYFSSPNSLAEKLLASFVEVEKRNTVDAYILKAAHLVDEVFGWLVILVILLLGLGVLRYFTGLVDHLRKRLIQPILTEIHPKKLWQTVMIGWIWVAGFVWGIGIATRVIVIFAGGIVGLYFLLKDWKRAIGPLVLYCLVALITAFLFYPQLWVAGFGKLVNALRVFSDFPFKEGRVFYQGSVFAVDAVPSSYLPFNLITKYTEPVIILCIIGIVIGVHRLRENQTDKILILLVALWFVLPVGYVILMKPPIYNNGRQFLFVIPPVFLLAGFALEFFFEKVPAFWIRGFLSVMSILPGLMALFLLHPYQYIYYNEFVGGPGNAAQAHEIDAWSISTAELANQLNRVAPSGSAIVFDNIQYEVLEFYVRPDLILIPTRNIGSNISQHDYLLVVFSGVNEGWLRHPLIKPIYVVERDGVALSMVAKILDGP